MKQLKLNILLGQRKAIFTVLVAGFCSFASAADTVRIGVSCPMTGGSADMGISMRNGIRLAVKEINGLAGGVIGKKIELVERDDLANVDTGKKVAEELILNEKVSATIGICNAGVGLASIDTYQNAKVPLIIAVSAGTPLDARFAASPDFYIFRTSPRDEIQAPFIVAEALKHGWRKIAVFADTSVYGESGKNYIEKALAANGLKPVSVSRFAIGVSDLSDQVEQARTDGADVVLVWTVGPEAAVLAKSIAKRKWTVPIIGSWPLSWRSFVGPSGHAAEGAQVVVSFVPQASTMQRNAFLLAYQQLYDSPIIPAPMAAAQGYDAMRILYYAIQQAQSDDPVKIKAALEDLQKPVAGVITTYNKPFTKSDHDALTSNMLVLGVVRNGQINFAYKEDELKSFSSQRKTQ